MLSRSIHVVRTTSCLRRALPSSLQHSINQPHIRSINQTVKPINQSINHTSSVTQPVESTNQATNRSFTTVGAPLRKKVTTVDLARMHSKQEMITMVTAYSYPSAVHVDTAGVDCLLVGDSLAMVELGYETTLPVTIDAMIHHACAVSRGASRALLVADLPFGSYESNVDQAFSTAVRFLKEAGMDAIKLEGGAARAPTIKHLVSNGIAVMGHIGLTPQHISVLGGFRAQGKTYNAAIQLIKDALALQEAGCFAIVIECVPPPVAAAITKALSIPTIGIGAGPHCGGQVLVYHDLLGFFQHAHHAKVAPRFSKTYAHVGQAIQKGLIDYCQEVKSKQFPAEQYSPYSMNSNQEQELNAKLEQDVQIIKQSIKQSNASDDTDETIKVY